MSAPDRVAAFVRIVGLVAACVLLPAQIVLSAGAVVARRFFHFQLTPVQELEWHLFFALVFLTLGSAYLADRHVRIDIVRDRMSERTRALIEIGGFFLALLPFTLIVLYLGSLPAWDAFVLGERSRAPLGLSHRWIIKSMIPVGALLLLLAGTVVTFRNFMLLSRPDAGNHRSN
jgi:TRAP-type mannitol/chloroaromatic compound transport system permease small subunit